MNILSLFDGISCARVALERAGFEIEKYFASEVDKYAIQVSLKNYPDNIQLGDVREVTGLTDIDLLIGGSPCQDLSIAGKRKGLDGDRSGLFWEYVRILKEVKPKYFILENVNSMPKEAKAIITEALGVEPIMINAALVSAQNRKRLFWFGQIRERLYFTGNNGDKEENNPRGGYGDTGNEKDMCCVRCSQRLDNRPYKTFVSGCDKQFEQPTSSLSEVQFNEARQNNGRVFDVYQMKVTQPVDKEIYLKDILENGDCDRLKSYCIDANYYQGGNLKSYLEKGRRQLVFNKSERVGNDSCTTVIECERLQGLPDDYTSGISNTQRYKCLGNAFNVDVVAHILSFIKK